MIADTDFILALIKESDWLKSDAQKVYNKHKGTISTTISVMIEIAILCKRENLNVTNRFLEILELISINENDYLIAMKAALFIEEDNLNVFDAFHAAYADGNTIISSDKVFDKVGIKRVEIRESH